MESNIIMVLGSCIFAVLFTFLLFIFLTATISLFKKAKYKDYEPKVSVIIPCYNEEKNIKRCLDSVYSLNYQEKNMEVIVVDDGSTDNTKKILKNCQKNYKNLIVLKGKHGGKSASLNLGTKRASNEIIFAVDADTILDKDALKKLVRPFSDSKVGLANGSCVARNNNTIISIFQKIEYHHNNLLRRSFSLLFRNGIWFFGAFVCYRKEALKKIGYFKRDTMTEDMDTAMEIYSAGYRTVNVYDALGYTIVPSSLKDFIKQRVRWCIGAFQCLSKNKKLFSKKSSPSILFLFVNQYWWSFYALVSFPIITYQIYYWMPYNTETFTSLFMYLFRWFSFAGPVYVLYKIPEWGISLYNIFGVLSGVISVFLITKAIYMFKDRLHMKNILGVFFYFPYTIILNSIIIISLIKLIFLKKKYFIY